MESLPMKISFVIPAYNEEHYLAECLQAIIADASSGNANFEIIVVNNASTDRTKNIAQSFPEVEIIDEPQKGLSRARQAGYLASTGEIIANIDADVRIAPGWTKQVLQEFTVNPRLVGLSGPFVYFDASRTIQTLVKHYYRLAYLSYLLNRHILKVSSLMQGGNFVVLRKALKTINGFNPEFEFYGEDADIARRLHKVGDVKFTMKLFVYSSARRLKGEGTMTMALRYSLNYVWVIVFKKPYTRKSIDIRY